MATLARRLWDVVARRPPLNRDGGGPLGQRPAATRQAPGEKTPNPADEVDEWGYESFPASDPPQH